MAMRLILTFALVAGVVLCEPIPYHAPFSLRIVDEASGRAVPHLRVAADNGTVCRTPATGSCYWWASSLMDRGVRFEIQDETNQFDPAGVTLQVESGLQVTVTVRRRL